MNVKWTCLHVIILAVAAAVFIQKSDSATTRTSIDDIINNSPDSSECHRILKSEVYCVPIRNCLTILLTMSNSSVRDRQCGPRNNPKRPYVCCERAYIEIEARYSTSSTQKTLLVSSAQSTSTTEETTDRVIQYTEQNNLYTSTEQAETEIQIQEIRPQLPPQAQETDDFGKGCGIQNIVSRVMGGAPAHRKEFPWLGRLLRRDTQGEMIFSCSGSLISSRVVLTAAHCLTSDSLIAVGELYAVSLGEHETSCDKDANECLLNKRTLIVSSFVVHPQYDKNSKNHDNDIGLIFLRDKVKFTDYIQPICLYESKDEVTQYYVAGWGITDSGMVSGIKLKTAVPSFSWEQCAERYKHTKVQLTSRQICAGGVKGMDACQGDSGGPLMMEKDGRWYAAGIVSFGLGCGRKGWPGIYVYVPEYKDWIRDTIRRNVS